MASSRETNTMEEVLRKMLKDIADAKATSDTDLPFLVDLETKIVGYLRNPTPGEQQGAGAAGAGGPGGPMAGAMGAVMGGQPQSQMGPPPGAMQGGGVPMMAAGMNASATVGMPNPDEFRRQFSRGETRHVIHNLVSRLPGIPG